MGRTIIVEDGIEDYTTALAAKKEPVAGLIFGQEINAQKSCVIHLSRSPEPLVEDLEDRSDGIPTGKSKTASTKSSKKTQNAADFFEEAVVLDHTQQVISFQWFSLNESQHVALITGYENSTRRYYYPWSVCHL